MNEWIGEAVGLMHLNKIKEVAEQMGVTSVYLSMIMNGKKKVKDDERMKSRVFEAIEAIEKKRQEVNHGKNANGNNNAS